MMPLPRPSYRPVLDGLALAGIIAWLVVFPVLLYRLAKPAAAPLPSVEVPYTVVPHSRPVLADPVKP